MATVIPIEELRRSSTAALFEGRDDVPVSIFVTAGHIVVVPAQTPRGFKGAGDDTLRVVSVHPSAMVEQTDL
jgi:hypothetical protein